MITHGGVGSIMDAFSFGKVPIVVPRRKELNEHSDDHQMQITKKMEKQGLIIPVYNIDDLENAIERSRKYKIKKREKKKVRELKTKYLEISVYSSIITYRNTRFAKKSSCYGDVSYEENTIACYWWYDCFS